MKKKLQKFFAMALILSMMMSLLSVSAFASEPVVTDNGDGTTTTETVKEEGNLTVVVKVNTETESGKVLSTETKETVTETVTNPETGVEEAEVVKETTTKTDYTGETNLTDMPEVSAGLIAGETTTGEASSADTKVEVVEGEDGKELEIETTITERDLTVKTDSIVSTDNKLLDSEIEQGETPEEQPKHGELDSIVDAEGNEVAAEKIDNEVTAETLNKVQNIAQNGYMSSANDLDALKEQIKASNNEATDDILAGLTEEKALEITQAALTATANGTEVEYTGAEKMLYDYLMSKASAEAPKETEKTMNIGNMNLVIGDKIGEKETTVTEGETSTTTTTDIYEGALNFSLTVVPTENDELVVCLQYVDADGAKQIVTKALGKENSDTTIAPDADGSYTIGGLKLSENSDLQFDLKLEGLQNLEDNLYIYSDGEGNKQVATGRHEVNTTTSVKFRFEMKKDTKQVEYKTVPFDVTVEVHDVIPTSKTATPLDANDQTDVTLSVPGKATDVSSDIVFIIGHGPSSNYGYILDMIHKMLVDSDGNSTKVKIGMVGFADTTAEETVLPLTEMKDTVPGNTVADYRLANRYTDEAGKNYIESLADYQVRVAAYEAKIASLLAATPELAQDMEFIIARALERAENVYTGVNMESSLITARDMLAADETVPAERKHMIMISTGLTYWFDNDAGKGSFIVRDNAGGVPQHVNYKYWLQHRNGTTSTSKGYRIPDSYKTASNTWAEAWNDYWTDIVSWIAKDQNKYVYSVRDTYTAFTNRAGSNATIVNKDDLALVNKENGKYVLAPYCSTMDSVTKPEGQHAVGYERAQYEAWVVYKQMETPVGESFTTVLGETVKGLGFNCHAIAIGKVPGPGEESNWLEDDQIGYNFIRMMGGENTVNYNSGDLSFFESIENKILYSCGIGTYVEDYIGYDEDDGNFEFIEDADYIKLNVGGVDYTTAMTEDTVEGSKYTFTAPGATEPTFWLDYYYGDGKTTEHFVWTFGENVSLANQASLTYKLQLTDKNTTVGTHSVVTNLHAVLYPMNSDGKYGDPQAFPVPEVSYTVGETFKVTVQYFEKDTTNVLHESYVEENIAGSAYDVTAKDKIVIDGYTYDSTIGDALTGTLNSDKVITVYYTKNGDVTPPTPPYNPPTGGDGGGGGGSFVIDEPPVPLAPIPTEPDLEEILDEEVPLAVPPMTNDASALWLALSALSGAGLAGVSLLGRKKREEI